MQSFPSLKKKIDNLVALHHYGNRDDLDKGSRTVASVLTEDQEQKMDWVRHRIARKHPVTGRTALYAVSGSSFGIEGMPEDEAIDLLDELKRPPTNDEIAERLDLDPAKMTMIQKAIQIYNAGTSGAPNDESNGIELLLVDDERPAEEMFVQNEDIQQILHLLDSLDEREATVLRMRYGLDASEPCTLLKIGEHLGLTRERVRQIEKSALANMARLLAGGCGPCSSYCGSARGRG